ncbi:MAG: hypothetical protein V3S46_01675 [Nitrospinota bacterium]
MSKESCLIPIPWETRNLGIESFKVSEYLIKNPDAALLRESIAAGIEKYEKIFAQARVPKENLAASPVLAESGFYFIEAVLTPYTVLKKNRVLRMFKEKKEEFVPRRINAGDLGLGTLDVKDKKLCGHVKSIAIESFWWDRFHLDPNCPEDVSKNRLAYFMEDLLGDEKVSVDLLEYGGKTIAFMARRGEDLILAGFERQYEISGLSDFFWLSVLERMAGQGHEKAETLIYHNNTSVLNLYVRLGFAFKNPGATFHYWSHPLKD